MVRKLSKAKKPEETMRQRQQRLLREQRASKAAKPAAKPAPKPTPKPAPKPAAKPAAKVNGQQPRAITNGRSATMRQLRAKSIQAQRQAQGKSTAASRNPGITPDSARGQRISEGAKGQRVIGDSGQVRAAQTRGAQIKAEAQAKRAARPANQLRPSQGLSIGGGKLGAAAAGLQAYNTADGTLDAAKKRGDLNKRRQPSPEEKAQANREEQTARAKNAKRTGPSFDDAFRDARRAKVKTFTWKGKQYTTEIK
jgi:hypothetical protein